MGKTTAYENLISVLNPHKEADKAWFLELLDAEKQKAYEDEHMAAVMTLEDVLQKNQGALALLQKSVLDEAKKKIGESFYMLPVSIFELMIVPESQADEVEEMKKAIIESNKELPAEYLLSNSVYYYGDKGEAEVAG